MNKKTFNKLSDECRDNRCYDCGTYSKQRCNMLKDKGISVSDLVYYKDLPDDIKVIVSSIDDTLEDTLLKRKAKLENKNKKELIMNYHTQYYKDIPVKLIDRGYCNTNAKRFILNGTNQNVWIPNKHLHDDGTIKDNENLDYVFRKSQNQLNYAGIVQAIPCIKKAIKGHVQLSSLSHLKDIDLSNYDTRLFIVRSPGKVMDSIGKQGFVHVPQLSPSVSLLSDFKKNEDWSTYTKRFAEEMNNRQEFIKCFNRITELLDKGVNVLLVCFCGDFDRCHRGLIGDALELRGYEVKFN